MVDNFSPQCDLNNLNGIKENQTEAAVKVLSCYHVIERSIFKKVMFRFFVNHIRPIVFQTEITDMRQAFLRILLTVELHPS